MLCRAADDPVGRQAEPIRHATQQGSLEQPNRPDRLLWLSNLWATLSTAQATLWGDHVLHGSSAADRKTIVSRAKWQSFRESGEAPIVPAPSKSSIWHWAKRLQGGPSEPWDNEQVFTWAGLPERSNRTDIGQARSCGGFVVVALLTFFREPVCCMTLELFGDAIHASALWVLGLIAVRQHHILADLLQWDFSHGAGTVTLALSS
jgi:hypothetical protein